MLLSNTGTPHWNCFQGSPGLGTPSWAGPVAPASHGSCQHPDHVRLVDFSALGAAEGGQLSYLSMDGRFPQGTRMLLPWPRACGNPGGERRERCRVCRAVCRHAKLLSLTEDRFITEVIFCVNLRDSV